MDYIPVGQASRERKVMPKPSNRNEIVHAFGTTSRVPCRGSTYSVLVLPDIHVPYEDKRTIAAVERYMAANTFDHYIQLGDLGDYQWASSHDKDYPLRTEGLRIQTQYEQINEMLSRHEELLLGNNPDCRMTLLEGNHEYRVEAYMERNPELAGLVGVERSLVLAERGAEWVRCYSLGQSYKLGKCLFHHGKSISPTHAKRMVEDYGHNIVYGHTHDVAVQPKVQLGRDATIAGRSIGFLGRYDMPYIVHNPTKWQQAFAVMYFQPSGAFNIFVVEIFNHSFTAPDGKFYKG